MPKLFIITACAALFGMSTVNAGTYLAHQPCSQDYSQEQTRYGTKAHVVYKKFHGSLHHTHTDGNWHGHKSHTHAGIKTHRGHTHEVARKCIDARWLDNRDLQRIRVKYPSQAICYHPNQF